MSKILQTRAPIEEEKQVTDHPTPQVSARKDENQPPCNVPQSTPTTTAIKMHQHLPVLQDPLPTTCIENILPQVETMSPPFLYDFGLNDGESHQTLMTTSLNYIHDSPPFPRESPSLDFLNFDEPGLYKPF